MKKSGLLTLLILLLATFAFAQNKDKKPAAVAEGDKGKALIQKNNCIACHASKGVVAPEFKDVLGKYTDAEKFQKMLAKPPKSGKFPGAMPPVTVSKEEAKAMLAYLQNDLKKSVKTPAKK
ncbi:MAG: cytochrome c [Bacteroidetes bacterium]|nr:cytochrome c [Bacteroidota bacterium]